MHLIILQRGKKSTPIHDPRKSRSCWICPRVQNPCRWQQLKMNQRSKHLTIKDWTQPSCPKLHVATSRNPWSAYQPFHSSRQPAAESPAPLKPCKPSSPFSNKKDGGGLDYVSILAATNTESFSAQCIPPNDSHYPRRSRLRCSYTCLQ